MDVTRKVDPSLGLHRLLCRPRRTVTLSIPPTYPPTPQHTLVSSHPHPAVFPTPEVHSTMHPLPILAAHAPRAPTNRLDPPPRWREV
ncbi:hypothetical protein EI94DRAFT_86882 [Lactarius quietus]|nr:hypothetical protein EI94DRAFT_86882 [Lactarius quietus]